MAFAIGLAIGAALFAFLWFPHWIFEWFIASLVPGVIAFRFGMVPDGYSPPRISGVFAGLWFILFWVPLALGAGRLLGVLA